MSTYYIFHHTTHFISTIIKNSRTEGYSGTFNDRSLIIWFSEFDLIKNRTSLPLYQKLAKKDS